MLPRCRIEPEVLEWARTSIRLDIADAARRARVLPDTLAQWEASGATLAFTKMEMLAQAYRVPVAALLFPTKPTEAPLPVDRRALPNKAGYNVTTATILAVMFARSVQSASLELADLTGALSPLLPQIGSGESACAAAERVRGLLGVSIPEQRAFRKASVAMREWSRALEAIGVYVLHRSWPIHEGRAFSIGGIRPVIVLNDADEDVAQVFSLFHELCHILRGEESLCDAAYSGYDEADRRVEVFCNAFAGELLVPPHDLIEHPTVAAHQGSEWSDSSLHRIALDFAVSRETVLRRLLTQGLTTPTVYERERERLQGEYDEYVARTALRRKSTKSKGGPPWPDRVVHSRGTRFSAEVVAAHSAGLISSFEAGGYLGTTPRHLPGIRELLS